MAKESFTPATLSFEDIIDNSKKYVVPKYQRDYSWNNLNDEWDLLWEDIISNNIYHYVGILVLQEGEKEINIIDGQQRLTTITLIILASLYLLNECADKEKDEQKQKEIKERLDILMNKYIGKKAEDLKYYNKISLNINNRSYFSDICNIQQYSNINKVPEADDLKTNAFIYKCLKYYYKQIKRHLVSPNSENILDFVKNNITNKLIFTTIQVAKDENAYLLFETLNSRSIELTAYDLLKNHLLSKAGEKFETSMLDDLNKIVLNIGNHDITSFISLDWNSRNSKIPSKRVYRTISSSIINCEQAFKYVRELKKSSLLYLNIKNYNHEDKETKELLKILSYIPQVKQHYLILLSLMKTERYSLKKVLKALLNLTIRYNYISQGQANKQETIYNKIACNIFNQEYVSTDEIVKALNSSDLDVPDDEFIAKFTKKQFANEKLDRYILAKIEESYDAHTKIDYDNETIEHIEDRRFESDFMNRIGNLTLLTFEDNGSLSGKTYIEKREFYSHHPRHIVNMISSESWDIEAVDKRSRELAKIATKIFK